ncbi:MAG: family 43 glycosylhydrolase [Acidimicrobiales bacterium]
MRWTSRLAAVGITLLVGGAALIVPQLPDVASASAASAHISVTGSASPAFVPNAGCGTGNPAYNFAGSGDAADPQVVYSAGTYYAFTTGNALGNNLAALVSSAPNSGYHSYTNTCSGSTALPSPSGWEQVNTQTSPGVFDYGGHWVMFYDAAKSGHATDSGFDCLAVATAASISPTNVQFTDASGSPLECQSTGSIDPQPYVDPSTGTAYLVWKQNDGGSAAPAYIWAEQLDGSGTGFAPGSSPTLLMTNNTVTYPWETTVENPSMAATGGGFYLAFSAGVYTSSGYSEGIATCSGPLGPCGAQSQILTSYGSVLGPGGGALFSDASGSWWLDYAAWQGGSAGCTSYACGAARQLFVASIELPSINGEVPCNAPAAPSGYYMVATDGGIFNYGNLPFCGSAGGIHLNKPVVAMAPTHDGGGYWLVASDGGIFTYGDANFYGSTGNIHLNQPIVGMAATPDGGGYWLVATDGGIFNYGDAKFYGSTGNIHLNQPIVAMAPTHDGGGYWLVASDGGIFSYGDASFHGSTGNIHLNKPIVGMAATPDGGGYWLVATDGGIFNFGDAPFFGSAGNIHLNQPIVAMAPTHDGGGYWLVASDGGIFTYGDATFLGSTGNIHLNKPIVGMAGV